jgi:integrase
LTCPFPVRILERMLSVEHQLVSLTGRPDQLAELKTDSSVRTIPLPEFVLSALARHLERYGPGEWGLLFTQPSGLPVSRNRFGDEWRATVKRAGMPVGTRFHDLRHFYTSLLIQAGESVTTVQARLGHKSATVTLDVYGHLWPDSEDKTRAAVDAVLMSASAAPAAQ